MLMLMLLLLLMPMPMLMLMLNISHFTLHISQCKGNEESAHDLSCFTVLTLPF